MSRNRVPAEEQLAESVLPIDDGDYAAHEYTAPPTPAAPRPKEIVELKLDPHSIGARISWDNDLRRDVMHIPVELIRPDFPAICQILVEAGIEERDAEDYTEQLAEEVTTQQLSRSLARKIADAMRKENKEL